MLRKVNEKALASDFWSSSSPSSSPAAFLVKAPTAFSTLIPSFWWSRQFIYYVPVLHINIGSGGPYMPCHLLCHSSSRNSSYSLRTISNNNPFLLNRSNNDDGRSWTTINKQATTSTTAGNFIIQLLTQSAIQEVAAVASTRNLWRRQPTRNWIKCSDCPDGRQELWIVHNYKSVGLSGRVYVLFTVNRSFR